MEEGDRGDQEEKRGNPKGREQASQWSLPYVLSTVWTPQRYSQSYTEKRRGRKETEVNRRIKWGIKRRETDPASNQFPKYSLQPKIQRDPLSLVEKKKGWGEIEETWWRKRRVKRGREQSGQWSCSQVKVGTEDWVLKVTKLTINTKKQRLKILI